MPDWIDFRRWDLAALADAWRSARPFPHVIIDQLVEETALDALRRAACAEQHSPERSEIVEAYGSLEPPRQPPLRSFAGALGGAAGIAAVRAISGKEVTRVELRSYVYRSGGYLLPHADWRVGMGRQVAYAWYLTPAGGCDGGELALHDCAVDDTGEIVATTRSVTIAHRPNRLVLFDVSPRSLHEVLEITDGTRLSLAGWYL